MFTIDPNIKEFVAKDRNIQKVYFSMNIHQVATPEMILEEARSYILFFRESPYRISAYIALHLRVTNRKLYYAHSSNPYPDEKQQEVEEEALTFAEGLGAVMDEIDMSKLSQENKNSWVAEQEIFNPKPAASETAQPEPVPSEQIPSDVQSAPVQPLPQSAPSIPVLQQPAPQPTPVVQPAAAPLGSPPPPVQQAARIPEPFVQPQFTPPNDAVPIAPPEPIAAPFAAAAKSREAIVQKTAKAGTSKQSKAERKKDPHAMTGVVSRDREALARLFTSF